MRIKKAGVIDKIPALSCDLRVRLFLVSEQIFVEHFVVRADDIKPGNIGCPVYHAMKLLSSVPHSRIVTICKNIG